MRQLHFICLLTLAISVIAISIEARQAPHRKSTAKPRLPKAGVSKQYPSAKNLPNSHRDRSSLMQAPVTDQVARNTLALTSQIIRETKEKVLEYIYRKAIRRTDERYAPDYYLDQTDRDYFNEYHENWLGILYNDTDYYDDALLQRVELSLILAGTDIEKEGLKAYFAFAGINELLIQLGAGKPEGFSFDYRDWCDAAEPDCAAHLSAHVEINDAAAFNGKVLRIPGFSYNDTVIKLSSTVGAKSSGSLQVQVAATELNPFMFDPSIKRLAGPIVQVLVLDTKTQLRVDTDQLIHLEIPYNFLYYNEDEISLKRDAQFFPVLVKSIDKLGPSDYPVLKMTLLPKTVFTEEMRPTPRMVCQGNVTDEPTKIQDITRDIYVYPAIYNRLIEDEHGENHVKTTETVDYYLALFPQEDQNFPEGSTVNLSVEVFRANCVFRDEDKHIWSEKGCWANEVELNYIHCTCPHLSTFSAAIMTTPTFLDVVDEISLDIVLDYNYIILGIVSAILIITGMLLVFCHVLGIKDAKNPGIHILADPTLRMEQHFYLVTVYSGGLWSRRDTTGNISLQIYGSNGTSLPFVLREDSQKMHTMRNNHVDSFLVSNFKGLGNLEKIRIWRDDHGNKPDWTCRKVMVQCLRSGKMYTFLVQRKFTLKFYGCATDHEVHVATEEETLGWKRLFSEFVYEGFQDRHSFLSTLKCSPSVCFSRCQRLACAATSVALYFVPIYLYRQVFYRIDTIEPAELHFEALQILEALCIFLITMPIEAILRLLFGHIQPKNVITLFVWKTRNIFSKPNEQVFGYMNPLKAIHSEIRPVYFNQQCGKLEEDAEFSLPGINSKEAEDWIEGASTPRRFSYRESIPTDWIRSDSEPNVETNRWKNVDRGSKIERIRESLPTSFTFSIGENSAVEDLIQDEIKRKEKFAKGKYYKKKEKVQLPTPAQISHDFPAIQVLEVASQPNSHQIVQIFTCLHPPMKKTRLPFPHCCVAFAWIFSAFIFLGSLTMAAFFGLRCGPILRWEIISDFCLTFLLSTLIFQPVYIILQASIKASFFRVSSEVDDRRFQVIFQKPEPETSNRTPYEYMPFLPERAHPPLDEGESFKSKLKAVRTSHSRRNVIMLIVHAILMSILISITYTNYSRHDYLQIRGLKGLLCVERCWQEVQNTDAFYEYLEDILSKIYPVYYNDGTTIPYFADVPVFLADETSMLVGVPRLHQFRIDPESTCSAPTNFSCLSELFINFETRDFDPKWLPEGSSYSSFPNNDVWKYQDSPFSKMTVGELFFYPSGGYMSDFGRNLLSSYTVLNYLRKHKWIDGRTRGVFLELATYNPNVNLFVYTKLMAEISGSGVWFTSSDHYPITLTDVGTFSQESYSLYLSTLFALTVLALFGKVALQIREWVIYRKVTYSEVVLALLTMTSLIIGVYRLTLVINLKNALDKMRVNDHIIFDKVCFWDQWQQDMFTLTFSFAVLMILGFIFKTKREFFMLDLCLKLSAKYLWGHGLLMFIMLVSFAVLGYVVFSADSFWFHSLPAGFNTLLQEIIGSYLIYELSEEERLWGQIFEVVFTFAVVIVGINLMISILDNGFTEARRIAQEKTYWMSYFYFVRKYFPQKPHFRGYPLIHPQRLLQMQRTSATFLRGCFQTQELQRKQRMFEVTQDFLNPRGFSLVSNSLRKKRMRAKVRVEKRLEVMRFLVNYLLSVKMSTVLTPGQIQVHMEFSRTILDLKLRKLEEKVEMLEEAVGKVRFRERSSSIVL